MTSLEELDRELSQREGQADRCAKEMTRVRNMKEHLVLRGIDCEEAQLTIQEVARITQEQLEYKLSELASLALETVFPDPYKLRIKFENKRGRTEASLMFEDVRGNLIDPMDASGVGPVDVAALALRLTLLCSSHPKPRPVVLLDEPFRYVSRDLQSRVRTMLREIAQKLKVQFIIITHDEELEEAADRVFRVQIDREGVSHVTVASATRVTEQSLAVVNPLKPPVLGTFEPHPLPLPPPDPKPARNPYKRRDISSR